MLRQKTQKEFATVFRESSFSKNLFKHEVVEYTNYLYILNVLGVCFDVNVAQRYTQNSQNGDLNYQQCPFSNPLKYILNSCLHMILS